MNLQQLKYAVEIARVGSISKAAKNLYMGQPNLSKSIKELEEIRQRTLNNINMRKDSDSTRIVVGMATCGIAAGARPVLLKFMEEISQRGLSGVTKQAA